MNADAILFALLAVADAALLIHLHRKRSTRRRKSRMAESLRLAIRRENGEVIPMMAPKLALRLRRAS